MTGKFKIYVMNRDAHAEHISFLQCNPIVSITFGGADPAGVWRQFMVKVGAPRALAVPLSPASTRGRATGMLGRRSPLPRAQKPEGWEEKIEEGGSGPQCWYVCDLHVTQDSSMSEQSLECTEMNKLMNIEPGNDGV